MIDTSFNTNRKTPPPVYLTDTDEILIASGVFDFGHTVPNHNDQVPFRITLVNSAYYIQTEYRNIGRKTIGKKEVDSVIEMLNSSLCPFLQEPTGTVKITEPKPLFMEKYFSFDDSYRPIDLLLAIAEVESAVAVNSALSRFMVNGITFISESEKQKLTSWGRYIGSEHVRIPRSSKYHIEIERLKSLGDTHFNRGYKQGVLIDSPPPLIQVDESVLAMNKIEIQENSVIEFQQSIARKRANYLDLYDYPQYLTKESNAHLQQMMTDYLPMALEKCDGTNRISLQVEEYGYDVLTQIRDELLHRGHIFSEQEIEQFDMLDWPITDQESEFKALNQISRNAYQAWNSDIDSLVYGEKSPNEVEREEMFKSIFSAVNKTSSNSLFDLNELLLTMGRNTNYQPIISKSRLRYFIQSLRTFTSSLSVGVTDLAPGRRTDVYDETIDDFDDKVFWTLTCQPTVEPEFWSTIIQLQIEANVTICVSQKFPTKYGFAELELNNIRKEMSLLNY